MNKKAELEVLVKCCETRFNRGVAANWKHHYFADLSQEIFQETGVVISQNTLKRIFGKIAVDDDYLPQQATIEALKVYCKYQPEGQGQVTPPPDVGKGSFSDKKETLEEKEPFASPQPDNKRKKKLIAFSILIVVITVCGLGVMALLKPKEKNLSARIALREIEGLLPATAFFDAELPESKDSLFVDFGDKSALVYVQPSQKILTHIYLFPGVFLVTVRTRLDSIAFTKVSIRSDKWIGMGYRRKRYLPQHYYEFPAVKTGSDSLFHIDNSLLHNMGLDTAGSFFTRLCNFSPVENVSPDNFIFESTFKSKVREKGIYCHSIQFQIWGMDNIIRFTLVRTGCSLKVLNTISEVEYMGKKTNLSQFAMNLENWNSVRLVNRDKQVSFYVNDRQLFSGTYQNSLGELQGVVIEFEGNGFVKTCELKSTDGKSLYRF